MSIYEYDKEFEEKKLRKAEFEYGQHELLKTQIQKKLAKGKSINEFADALEGSPLVIQKFVDELEYEKAHSELIFFIYCSQFPAGEWACACIMPWLYVQNGLVYERCRCILGSSR